MSGLETAIRNALARSERANAEVRARIYQSARNALEAGLRKQEINDPETIATQRHRLEATIHEIEAEERAQLAAAPAHDDVGRVEPVVEARPEPVLRAEREVRPEPALDAEPRVDARQPAATGDFGAIRPERADGFAKSTKTTASASNAAASESSDFRPERVAKAFELSGAARATSEAGIRHRHPDWSDEQVHEALMELLLGRELTRAVRRSRLIPA